MFCRKSTKHQARLEKVAITTSEEPTIEEALSAKSPEVGFWKKTIPNEFRTLDSNRTSSPVLNMDKPAHTLSYHIVLEIMRDENRTAKNLNLE